MTLRDHGLRKPRSGGLHAAAGNRKGPKARRLRMLEEKRWSLLDDIHCRENRLEQLDGLRHCLRKQLEAHGYRQPVALYRR